MKLWMSRRYMQNLVWSKRESRMKVVPLQEPIKMEK